jgi:nucleotide-binding universal stress UspA family protein
MSQKILIAFDDSENAMRAVEYVAGTFNKDCSIKLFCVVPDTAALCDMNSPELTPYFKSQQQAFCTLEDQKKSLVNDAFAKARQCLLDAGFSEDNISFSAVKKNKGIARDIVNTAGSEYDLIVIGRRGITGIKDYFLGSISQKVLHLATDVSILIVN